MRIVLRQIIGWMEGRREGEEGKGHPLRAKGWKEGLRLRGEVEKETG